MQQNGHLLNFINGQWTKSSAGSFLDITNPATAQALTRVPLSPGAEVAAAIEVGQKAFAAWKETPVGDRIQPMFKLKMLLEENLDDIARTITNECGKTYSESAGELRRGIEMSKWPVAHPSSYKVTITKTSRVALTSTCSANH